MSNQDKILWEQNERMNTKFESKQPMFTQIVLKGNKLISKNGGQK